MDAAVWREIEDLCQWKPAALRAKYEAVFGVETRSANREYLLRRIAWRLQARAEGDLSERARRRAAELADDAEIRLRAPKGFAVMAAREGPRPEKRSLPQRDWRLPRVGTILTRRYRGEEIVVHVASDGFAFQGRHYRSLSAIAREVTGTRWNGLAFFHLTELRRG